MRMGRLHPNPGDAYMISGRYVITLLSLFITGDYEYDTLWFLQRLILEKNGLHDMMNFEVFYE